MSNINELIELLKNGLLLISSCYSFHLFVKENKNKKQSKNRNDEKTN